MNNLYCDGSSLRPMTVEKSLTFQCIGVIDQRLFLLLQTADFLTKLVPDRIVLKSKLPRFTCNLICIQRCTLYIEHVRNHLISKRQEIEIYVTARGARKKLYRFSPPILKCRTTITQAALGRFKMSQQILRQRKYRVYSVDSFAAIIQRSSLHLMLLLPCRHCYRYCNSQQCTQRLYPPRGAIGQHIALNPIGNRAYKEPHSSAAEEQAPQRPQTSLSHITGYSKPHMSLLRLEQIKSSLPAPRYYVQRVAL